jgi:hypothetical protein
LVIDRDLHLLARIIHQLPLTRGLFPGHGRKGLQQDGDAGAALDHRIVKFPGHAIPFRHHSAKPALNLLDAGPVDEPCQHSQQGHGEKCEPGSAIEVGSLRQIERNAGSPARIVGIEGLHFINVVARGEVGIKRASLRGRRGPAFVEPPQNPAETQPGLRSEKNGGIRNLQRFAAWLQIQTVADVDLAAIDQDLVEH